VRWSIYSLNPVYYQGIFKEENGQDDKECFYISFSPVLPFIFLNSLPTRSG
jgi:hypothetical protein